MENNSLEVLTANGAIVSINGERLEIKPLKIAKLMPVTQALQAIAKDVLSILAPGSGVTVERGKDIEINAAGWELINAAIGNNIESLVTIMAAYTRKPREWFLDEETGISIDDAILLLLAIIEAHYDFFTRRLAPALTKIRAKAEKK